MATAGIVRKSALDFDPSEAEEYSGKRRLIVELLIVAALGALAGVAHFYFDESLKLPVFAVVGAGFVYLSLKDVTYALCVFVFSVGMSPDTVLKSTFGINNLRYEDLLIGPIFLLLFFQVKARGLPFVKTSVAPAVIKYMGIVMLATIIGVANRTVYVPTTAWIYYAKYVEYFTIAWIFMNACRSKEDMVKILLATLATSLIVAYVTFSHRESILMEKTTPNLVRATGPEGETANVLGGYFLAHLMLVIGVFFMTKNYLYKVLIFLIWLAVLVPFMYTFSRTSFGSLIFGLVLTMILVDYRYIILLLALSFFSPILFSVQPDIFGTEYEDLVKRYLSILDVFSGGEVSSFEARQMGWIYYLRRSWDVNPLLGGGMYSTTLGVDSSFVKKFSESGLLGVLTFSWLLIRMLRIGYEVARNAKNYIFKTYAVSYVGIISAMVMHAVGVTTFSTIRSAEPFFYFSGLMLAVHAMHKREEQIKEEEKDDEEVLNYFSEPLNKPAFSPRS